MVGAERIPLRIVLDPVAWPPSASDELNASMMSMVTYMTSRYGLYKFEDMTATQYAYASYTTTLEEAAEQMRLISKYVHCSALPPPGLDALS